FAWVLGERGGSPLALLVLALCVALLNLIALATGALRVYRCVAAEKRLAPTLSTYAPQFAVYFGSTMGAAYQVGMWLGYFERIGRRFVIVTRNLSQFRAIERISDAPIVHRPAL